MICIAYFDLAITFMNYNIKSKYWNNFLLKKIIIKLLMLAKID